MRENCMHGSEVGEVRLADPYSFATMAGGMNKITLSTILCCLLYPIFGLAGEEPIVVYWNSEAGKAMRARIQADADYWQLSPSFAVQSTQAFCGVASAITVLNAMPAIQKPVDPVYAPYAYFTQSNFFTPDVTKVISQQTVLAEGMTREEMAKTLIIHGASVQSIAGDQLNEAELRALLQKALGDDGQFVLVNYLRATLEQEGKGHWSALAAFDAQSDRVLILDVAKYKYAPGWVSIKNLRKAMATLDTTSNKMRGLVIVSK